MTIRVSPPSDAKHPTILVNGRTYTCAVGSTLDVPDHDAQVMSANGWHSHGLVTTTAGRPAVSNGANPVYVKGAPLIDSTLSAVIFYDGAAWRNYLTGAVV